MTFSWRNNDLGNLIDEIVDSLWVAPDEEDLRIKLCSGKILGLPVSGDCCSQSWWADVTGVKQIIRARVTAVAVLTMPDEDPEPHRTRQEYDALYGIKVVTTQGACDFIFRNSSNGYYGGWTDPVLVDDIPKDYRQITADWSA